MTLAAFLCACSDETPRSQLLVTVDTDAPVTSQIAERPEVSPQAAVDTLRVDILHTDGGLIASRELLLPDARDWPVSFGIATHEFPDLTEVRVRLRAFRAVWVDIDPETRLSEPFLETTIDRLLQLAAPQEGIELTSVLLSFDCMGVAARFLDPATTCIDIDRRDTSPTEGISTDGAAASRVGSSTIPVELPCRGPQPEGALCIPGGFTVIGDADLRAFFSVLDSAPFPLRPARLSPFWLDATELTVGRLRQLFSKGLLSVNEVPVERDAADEHNRFCTWLGTGVSDNDAYPVNCIEAESADAICRSLGGALPSEAQWSHVAHGRGQGRRYPWGDSPPSCCTTSSGRLDGLCAVAGGPEPVGSHLGSEACGSGDVSRDGIVDLGGSMVEWLNNRLAAYTDPCWAWEGIAVDPVCPADPNVNVRRLRGGDWSVGPGAAFASIRKNGVAGNSVGLRCAYPDLAP